MLPQEVKDALTQYLNEKYEHAESGWDSGNPSFRICPSLSKKRGMLVAEITERISIGKPGYMIN